MKELLLDRLHVCIPIWTLLCLEAIVVLNLHCVCWPSEAFPVETVWRVCFLGGRTLNGSVFWGVLYKTQPLKLEQPVC